ncbi:LYR motif-containing protein 1-like isoform X2 [Salvelinus sp. IW2-2015]|uniref:LYR motif-containing protein 1-like isoform X2 n=1 Tax=Salvelinus sp. IW2-2015 TaxID=2691554 RepID=UPI000CDFE263|nr:LYR motif-containing protein 1-like isoform X3 [Salvelinus alpinus]
MRHVVKKLTAQQGISDRLGRSPHSHKTLSDRRYIVQEAQTLFRQDQQLTDQESIKKCLAECEARIEIEIPIQDLSTCL